MCPTALIAGNFTFCFSWFFQKWFFLSLLEELIHNLSILRALLLQVPEEINFSVHIITHALSLYRIFHYACMLLHALRHLLYQRTNRSAQPFKVHTSPLSYFHSLSLRGTSSPSPHFRRYALPSPVDFRFCSVNINNGRSAIGNFRCYFYWY